MSKRRALEPEPQPEVLAVWSRIAAVGEHVKEGRRLVARAIYYFRRNFRDMGFQRFTDCLDALTSAHRLFDSRRTGNRYLAGYRQFIVKLGYGEEIFERFEPSSLGEIAEKGVAQTREQAEEWLRLLAEKGMNEVRRKLKGARASRKV